MKKALNQIEVENLVQRINSELDAHQLQEIQTNDRGLALGFQGRGRMMWLIIDLVPNAPAILMFENSCPFRKAAKAKPLGLFMTANIRGMFFQSAEVLVDLGRVVKIILRSALSPAELELRLIPKQANLLVKANGKSISWEKPLELTPPPVLNYTPEVRSIADIHNEWLQEGTKGEGNKKVLDPRAQWEKQRLKDIEKKTKARDEILKQIESEDYVLWREAGEYLKETGSMSDLPPQFVKLMDSSKTVNMNLQHCFEKSKQLKAKKEGARSRYETLHEEISKLEAAKYSPKKSQVAVVDLMKKANARGRKLHLESGAIAYCGKSGADNLSLLRQAKSWDYWLHLRDYPGAHAIIHRDRHQILSDVEVAQVAAWVAKESLPAKTEISGQRFAVVMVECRFVKPIKGDKLGRVSYHSEKSFNIDIS